MSRLLFSTCDVEEQWFLVWTSEWSWCGKTQIARIEADRAAIVAEWNSGGRPDMKAPKVEYKCSRIV